MLIQQTKRKKTKHKLLAWFTLATFIAQPALVMAQAVADPNAAAANRPGIDNAQNNVPIVQIAAPSAAGVSHNLYQQLNIDPSGLIFNNSLGITSTQLAGYIAANPNLSGSAARIILNEVTGTGTSYLKGYAEIAGQKADLIIANPNGIVGDGFGFINANRAVLTTGTPVFGGSGSLEAFRVTQGTITVQGQGIDATGADRLDLLSRAAAINAGLWAKDLNVVTGANQIDYSTLQAEKIAGEGVQPTVALDVSALGGMYAHKIKLVGTEKGVGVNSQGTLAASSGDLTLTQEGKIQLGGKTSASGTIALTSQDDIVHTGQLYGQTVAVQAAGALANSGLLAAAGDTTIVAQTLQSTGTLGAGIQTDGKSGATGNLTITTSGATAATGRTVAAGDLVIQGTSLNVSGGTTYAGHNATLTAAQGNLDNTYGAIEAGNSLTVTAQGTVTNRDRGSLAAEQITVTATNIDNHNGSISQSGSGTTTLTALKTLDNTNGKILTNGLAAVNAKALYNDQGVLAAEQGIAVQADTLRNQHGTIASAGAVQLTAAGTVTNAAGLIEAGHGLALTAGSLDNTSGSITSLGQEALAVTVSTDLANQSGLVGGNGAVQITAGTVANQAGKVTAKENLTIQSASEINNTTGTLSAGQDLSLKQTTGTLTNTAGTIQAGQDLTIAADKLTSTGKLFASRDMNVAVSDISTSGQLLAGRNLQLTATETLLNQGTVQADGVTLQADGTLTNDGNMTALQGLAISGKDIQNGEAGAIKSGSTLHMNATDSLTNAGTVYGKGELHVQAGEVANAGAVASAGNTVLTANTLTSTGTLAAGLQSDGTLGTTGNLTLITTGHAAAKGQTLAGGNLVMQGAAVDIRDGTTLAGHTATITATDGDVDNTGGSLTAKDLTIQAQGALVNNNNAAAAGSIKAEQLTIHAQEIRNQGGALVQYGQTDLTLSAANGIDNTGGQIATNSTNLTIATSDFTNTQGQVQHAGNGVLTLDATGHVANDSGKLISNGAMNLSAHEMDNTSGTITAQRQLDIAATSVDNTQGVIVGKEAVTLTSQGAIVNRAGTLEAGKGLTMTARSLDNQDGGITSLDDSGFVIQAEDAVTNAGGLIGGNGNVQVAAKSLDNTAGRIVAKADLALAVDGTITNTQGTVSAGHNLTVEQVTGSLTNNQGSAQAGNDLTIHTTELHNTAGRIMANRDLTLAGKTATTSGVLYGGRDVQITLAGDLTHAAGGEIQADRKLTLDADGTVTNSGNLTALEDAALRGGNLANATGASVKSGKSLTLSTTGNLINEGSLYAKDDVTATSAGIVNNSGAIAAGGDTALTAQSIQSAGTLIAGLQGDGSVGTKGALTITAAETAALNGRNLAGHTVTVTGEAIDTSNSTTYAGTRATLTATAGAIDNSGAALTAKDVAMNAQGAVINNKNAKGAASIQADKLSIQATSLRNQGGIIVQYGQSDLTLSAAEGIDNSGGQIATNSTNLTIDTNQLTNGQGQIQHAGIGNLVLVTSGQLDNTQGRIISNGALAIDSGAVTNTNGSVSAKEQLTIDSDSLANRQGILVSQKAIELTVQGAADNQQGLVEAGKGLQLTAQSLDNSSGKLTSLDGSGLTLTTDGQVHNQAGLIGSNGAITLTANGLTNTGGQVQAKTDLTVQAAHDVINTAGTLSAGHDLTLTQQAGTLTNTQGTIQAGNDLSVHAATLANTQGRLLAARDATLTGQTATNSGTLYGGRDVHVDLTGAFTNSAGGEIQADRKVALTAGGTLTNQGKITALQAVTLEGAAISNSATGAIKSGGNMTLAADGNLTNTGAVVAQGNLAVDSGAAFTSTGVLAAAGNATIEAQQVTASGTLSAGIQSDGSLGTNGDLTVTAANTAALQGQTLAAHDLTVTGSAVALTGGTAYAGHTAAITATTGSIDNTGATLEAKDTAKLTAATGSVINNKNTAQLAGTIRAGQLDITAKTIYNQGGALIQYGTGNTAITTTAFDNTGGQLATNGTNLTLNANTILNTNGQVQHAGTGVFSLQAAAELDNTGGRLITNGSGDMDTAVFTNKSGTVSAQKQLTVNANSLNSEQGILVTKDTLTVTAQGNVKNRQGIIEAGKGLSLTAQAVDNEHGSITSLGEQTLQITATGAVDNQSGLIGGNGQVTVAAASLANQSGTVQAQGNLTLTTPQGVNNTQGTLSAGKDLTLTQAGSTFVNDQGKVEAGQSLNMKTKEITNTAGRLAANKNVSLAFTGLTGDGTVEAGQDLALTIAGSFTNEAGNTWKANDNVTIAATGAITNRGSLEAGDNLTVSGSSVTNEATGLLAANKELKVTTPGDFTNAGSVFGKEITVMADRIVNANETAVIAANDKVKLFAATSVANLDGATIYSQGDIAIAGSAEQDAVGQYVTRTGELLNQSASIEADRDISISADEVVNKMRSYTVEEEKISETRYDQTGVYVSSLNTNLYWIYTEGGTTSAIRITAGGFRDIPALWLLNESIWERKIVATSPNAIITSGNNLFLNINVINNEQSKILAAGLVSSNGIINNIAIGNQKLIKRQIVNANIYYMYAPQDGIGYAYLSEGSHWIWSTDSNRENYNQFFAKPDIFNGPRRGHIGEAYTETVTEQLPGGLSAIFGGGKSVTIQGANINNVTLDTGNVIKVSDVLTTAGHNSNATNQTSSNSLNDTGINTNISNTNVIINTGTSAASSLQVGSAAVTQNGNSAPRDTGINTNLSNGGVKINTDSGVASSGQAANAAVAQENSTTIAAQINTNIPTSDIPADNIQTLLPSAQTGPVTPPQTNNGGTITVPANGMYAVHTDPTAHYLIETNSRFTSYKNFISSDYMLEKLNINPANTMKRLGDGFYEQKLVREQITDLTGRVYLSGYESAEAQYQALLENGAAVAQTFHLQVGIALSDEQMKQLTTPIVWMVEQEVNGQKVLVPVVYLPQIREGDLKTNGAVIAADVVTITAEGKVSNAGTIKANEKTQISAAAVSNLGGTIDGGNLTKVAAAEDLFNLSGTISGDNVSLSAGRNFTSETVTFTSELATVHSSTTSGNTATVTAGQNLTISAGEDLNLLGSQLHAGADLDLTAGGNLDASSILTQESWNAGNFKKQQVTNELTTLKSGGNLTISSKQDLTLTGVQASAGENLNIAAGGDILLNTVKDSDFSDVKTGSSKNYTRVMTNDETVIGTNLAANKDLTINTDSSLMMEGSSAVSENGKIAIAAADDITIGAVTETHEALTESKKTKSGFLSKKTTIKKDYSLVNEVVGSTISGDSVEITTGTDLTVQAGNIVGTHDVNLTAGNDLTIVSAAETGAAEHYKYTKKSGLFSGGGLGFTIGSQSEKSTLNEQTLGEIGSTVGSLEGNITLIAGNQVNSAGTAFISAKDLDITGKTVNIDNTVDTYDSQSKYEFKQSGLSVSLNGGSAQTAMDAVSNIERASQVSDERLQALYAYKAYEDVQKLSKIKDEAGAKKGVSVSVSIGSSKFTSEQTVHSETVNTSDITAGGAVTIKATEGDVNLSGVKLDAKDLTITATDNINIDAAQNKLQIDTNTSSSSWAVGASLGTNTSYFANVSKGNGKENQDTITQVGSLLNADGTVQLVTGKDLSISGSQVKGGTILADIGGDLNIVSLQDTDDYIAKNKNSGIGVSTGPSGGVTGSYNQGKTNSTYASVTEQAGIFAGEGGFDITVGGNTDLKGAVISSEANPNKNKLSTDTLTFSDIENKAEYSASSVGVNLDTRKTAETKDAGLTPDIGTKATGDADSTTKSAIAEGKVEVRNGDTDLSNLSRDTANSLNALGKIFDKKTVAEQQELAKVFGEVAFKAIGDLALKNGWKEGGSEKVALHFLVGGIMAQMGGGTFTSGAVGAGVNEAIQNELKKIEDPALHQWASVLIGSIADQIVSGNAQTGASTAASGTKNNLLETHADFHIPMTVNGTEIEAEQIVTNGDMALITVKDQGVEVTDTQALKQLYEQVCQRANINNSGDAQYVEVQIINGNTGVNYRISVYDVQKYGIENLEMRPVGQDESEFTLFLAGTQFSVGTAAMNFDLQLFAQGGMNNLRVLKDVRIKGYTVSMDLEKGGSGLLNIHIAVDGVKYKFDEVLGTFVTNAGDVIPRTLRDNPIILKSLEKAKERIASGWGS